MCKQDLLQLFLDAMDDLGGDAAKDSGIGIFLQYPFANNPSSHI
jgi:hypothetical protein